jgi:hypothetical protein
MTGTSLLLVTTAILAQTAPAPPEPPLGTWVNESLPLTAGTLRRLAGRAHTTPFPDGPKSTPGATLAATGHHLAAVRT